MNNPCETCGYAEGSPFCLQYCPYDAERKKKQEPCDDAINRNWLKTAIHNFYYGLKHIPSEDDIQAYIDAAPPITQKSGKWLITPMSHIAYCSECDYLFKNIPANIVKQFKYCPNCGIKIIGEE